MKDLDREYTQNGKERSNGCDLMTKVTGKYWKRFTFQEAVKVETNATQPIGFRILALFSDEAFCDHRSNLGYLIHQQSACHGRGMGFHH